MRIWLTVVDRAVPFPSSEGRFLKVGREVERSKASDKTSGGRNDLLAVRTNE